VKMNMSPVSLVAKMSKAEIEKKTAALPPPPRVRPDGTHVQPERHPYGTGEHKHMASKYMNKYEYRHDTDIMGYESADSSVSEYSVGSTRSSQPYTPH